MVFLSLGDLSDIGPVPLDIVINVEPKDESGPLIIHKVYAVGREEEESELVFHHCLRKRAV